MQRCGDVVMRRGAGRCRDRLVNTRPPYAAHCISWHGSYQVSDWNKLSVDNKVFCII